MHEYALAADIARRVRAEARRAGGRVAGLEVEIGAADRLDAETLAFWLAETLKKSARAGGAHVRVVRGAATLTCGRCGGAFPLPVGDEQWEGPAQADRCCPACRSDQVSLDRTTGCRILALRIEDRRPRGGRASSGKGP